MTLRLRRLLVPLDGSLLAEVVLPFAYGLADRCGAEVILLHVIEHDAPETIHGERHIDNVVDAAEYLAAIARRYRSATVPTDVHVHANPEREVARSIGDHARELGADLVVLATHGSGGLRGFLFGRIAQQALQYTAAPVLLIRPRDGQPPPTVNSQGIVVPLDGTADAVAALPMARMLARIMGCPLHLIRVVPTTASVSGERGATATFLPRTTAALLDLEAEVAHAYLNALVEQYGQHRPVTVEVRRGDIATELGQAIETLEADLVVMSTHGRAGLAGHLAGSVATRLLERITRPLLLVRITGP